METHGPSGDNLKTTFHTFRKRICASRNQNPRTRVKNCVSSYHFQSPKYSFYKTGLEIGGPKAKTRLDVPRIEITLFMT